MIFFFLDFRKRAGVFVDFNGTITRGSITWGAEPIAVCYSAPYIIAMLTRTFEIHNIYDQKLVQTVEFSQKLKTLYEGDLALVPSGDQIYCIFQKAFDKQVHIFQLSF